MIFVDVALSLLVIRELNTAMKELKECRAEMLEAQQTVKDLIDKAIWIKDQTCELQEVVQQARELLERMRQACGHAHAYYMQRESSVGSVVATCVMDVNVAIPYYKSDLSTGVLHA